MDTMRGVFHTTIIACRAGKNKDEFWGKNRQINHGECSKCQRPGAGSLLYAKALRRPAAPFLRIFANLRPPGLQKANLTQ